MSLRVDRLREVREKRGYTQRELAKICGIGENQINKYENGGGDPSLSSLATIAQALGVSTDYLLGLSDDPHNEAYVNLSPDELKLVNAYALGDSSTIIDLITRRIKQLVKEAEK